MSSASETDFPHVFVPGNSARTLILLHGTGGNEQSLLSVGRMLDPLASLLSPRGRILENGHPRFFRRLAEGVFDEADLIQRTHELADFIEFAAKKYQFSPKQLLAVGYSNGANIAASLLLLRPEVLAGAALLRPMVPLVPMPLPDLHSRPVGIWAGRSDPFVTPEQSTELLSLLERSGAAVTLNWESTGHELSQPTFQNVQAWLESLTL